MGSPSAFLLVPSLLAGCVPGGDDDSAASGELAFPEAFLWGTASSAWQVEGDVDASPDDGLPFRSNWTSWEDMGCIGNGDRNDVGAGFWTQWEDDLDRAQGLGSNTIRLGMEWARIEPADDQWDEAALQHYAEVMAGARARGMEPMVTLWHWVVPAWVQDPAADPMIDLMLAPPGPDAPFAVAFADFVGHVAPVLGLDVDLWAILNETFTVIAGGYLGGIMGLGCGTGGHPPGGASIEAARTVYANLLFAHAAACHTLRELDTVDANGDGFAAQCGGAATTNVVRPRDPTDPDDIAGAARIDWIYNHAQHHAWMTGELDLDYDQAFDTTRAENDNIPMDEGTYPELAGTLDWIGLNYYGPLSVEGIPGSVIGGLPAQNVADYDPTLPHSSIGFAVDPEGLGLVLDAFAQYGRPLYITENGFGTEADQDRPMYLVQHLEAAAEAIARGADLRGYYHWSLVDNFEWAFGYDERFGLFGVDFDDPALPRTRHPSADAYAEIIAAGAITDGIRERWVQLPYATDGR
jgi:beta-glucosidase